MTLPFLNNLLLLHAHTHTRALTLARAHVARMFNDEHQDKLFITNRSKPLLLISESTTYPLNDPKQQRFAEEKEVSLLQIAHAIEYLFQAYVHSKPTQNYDVQCIPTIDTERPAKIMYNSCEYCGMDVEAIDIHVSTHKSSSSTSSNVIQTTLLSLHYMREHPEIVQASVPGLRERFAMFLRLVPNHDYTARFHLRCVWELMFYGNTCIAPGGNVILEKDMKYTTTTTTVDSLVAKFTVWDDVHGYRWLGVAPTAEGTRHRGRGVVVEGCKVRLLEKPAVYRLEWKQWELVTVPWPTAQEE